MCLESQTWLPINSNPIFQPIGIDLSSQPLQNCVLSIRYFIYSIYNFYLSTYNVACFTVKLPL